ncbi:hypothetical protein [Actinophytocola sp.]|uniref:hypothetical protein n=1 Tax=Actinophytocola sp. TaxID=1872138 RepID=UPI002ED546D0
MTLYVVYVKDTGHVVGAVNAAGDAPPGEGDVGALVGDALPMRVSVDGKVVRLPLPAERLALHTADDEPRVFDNPLAYGVELAGGQPKPTLVELRPESPELAFSNNSLVVTVQPDDPINDTPVLALVSDGEKVHVRPWAIPAGGDSVEIPVTVSEGNHGVLVLVAGWIGILATEIKAARS